MLSETLKRLRNEKGLFQKDVAEYLGISCSAYGFYEQNKRQPDPETLKSLAEFFGVSVDYLLGEKSFETQVKYGEDLPEEALRELKSFADFLRQKWHGWKPGDPPR